MMMMVMMMLLMFLRALRLGVPIHSCMYPETLTLIQVCMEMKVPGPCLKKCPCLAV